VATERGGTANRLTALLVRGQHLRAHADEIGAIRLVVPHHVPAELTTRSISRLIGSRGEIAAVPPRVSRLDSEHGFGPGEIEMDDLTGRQHERELPLWLWKAGRTNGVEDGNFEPALARSWPRCGAGQPPVDAGDATTATATMAIEERGRLARRHQLQMPRVFSGPFEAVVVEQLSECQEHVCGREETPATVAAGCLLLVEKP
jgi:hypothetical protein